MYKSIIAFGLALLVLAVTADRPDIASTIPDSFMVEIALTQEGMVTTQKIYISRALNKAKSVQTLDNSGTVTTFITIADFTAKKTSVFSDDHSICYVDPITIDLNFVDDLRAIFNDPESSPMQEAKGMNMFTVNWKSIEGVDDWTHFYFEKESNTLRLFEHYFKDHSQDPWVAFEVVTPITPQEFTEADFINESCPITSDAETADM